MAREKRQVSELAAPDFAAWAMLWPAGFALLVLLVSWGASHLLPAREDLSADALSFQAVWLHYLALGTLLPLSLLWSRVRPIRLPRLKGPLGLDFWLVFGSLAFCLFNGLLSWSALWIAGLHFTLRAAWEKPREWRRQLPQLLLIWIGWSIAFRLIWWDTLESYWLGTPARIAVLLGCLGFSALLFTPATAPRFPRARRNLRIGGALLGGLVLALLSLRTPNKDAQLYHHWSAITGPAEMLRQGRFLYWDFPSQYGLLSTLTLAFLPGHTAWHSLWGLHAFLLLAGSLGVFALLNSLDPRARFTPLALLATIGAMFIFPGQAFTQLGPYAYPSVSMFRFFWVFALVILLVQRMRGRPFSVESPYWIIAGSLLWLLGSLWSSESAVYCSACWLPPHLIYGWSARKRRAPGATLLLALPLLLLGAALALIGLVYWAKLGHLPDAGAFFESSLSYAGGNYPILFSLNGPYVVYLFVFVLAMAATYWSWEESSAVFGSWAGISAALWAAFSYFVGRSHPNNLTNLTPFLLIGTVALLVAPGDRFRRAARACVIPLLCTLAIASARDGIVLKRVSEAWANLNAPLENVLLPTHPDLLSLFERNGVKADAPVVTVSMDGTPLVFDPRTGRMESRSTWLPAFPFHLLVPLRPERRLVYLERFLAGNPGEAARGGWLIADGSIGEADATWLYDYLKVAGFRKVREDRSGAWALVRYER